VVLDRGGALTAAADRTLITNEHRESRNGRRYIEHG
jgi:hypothetical protein